MPKYNPRDIEPKWQAYWDENGTFVTPVEAPAESTGKLYALDMFPYPSGEGLHVGHPEGYTATDIVCRRARMQGKHVLHPMGWDAFGLPAEQYAMKTGTHPAKKTAENIGTFKRQLKMLGFSYDWTRELATTDEDYYRWTQWIFLQLFDTWYDPDFVWTGPDGVERTGKGRPIAELEIPETVSQAGAESIRRYQDKHRLAYQHEAPVNWCPALGTVLANEEITSEGLSERGGHPVERVALRQWMLRITAYGDRLIDELESLDWSESIKALQRNWIGRSTGAEVDFFVGDSADANTQEHEYQSWLKHRTEIGFPAEPGEYEIRVYTTRPDTLYGATYMVLAPENPLVDRITRPEHREKVAEYRNAAARKSDLDRTDLAKEKTGVFTGAYAVNPVNGRKIPVWIADYVLASYGTGAVMAVPAHDVRDFEFAVTFGLPIKQVVRPVADHKPSKEEAAAAKLAKQAGRLDLDEDLPLAAYGVAVHSGDFDGKPTETVKESITDTLAGQGLGKKAINYRLRDWLFSRQHVWGEPFPVWHELDADGNATGLLRTDSANELPVRIPDDFDFAAFRKKKEAGALGYDPPLAESPDSWLYKTDSDGVKLKRETNSMPQWAGSCWYYLRYCDPKNANQFVGPEAEKYWLPVDLYVGGAEHAVLHLLYSRFWHKVLFDRGLVSTPEPFHKLVNQGMILGEPELTGYRTTAPSGSGVYDASVLKPLLQAKKHIQTIGALTADHTKGTLEERWPQYTRMETQGHTCLYGALKQAAQRLSPELASPADINQHDALEVVRRQIRSSATDLPADIEPLQWWNNERGVDATLRLFDDAVESLSAVAEPTWVSAADVTVEGDKAKKSDGQTCEAVKLTDDDVVKSGGKLVLKEDSSVQVVSQASKMSKSRGNVVNPDDVVDEYGADALRLYEMFMGPLEQMKPWSMSGVEGISRFLARAWRLVVDDRADTVAVLGSVQDVAPTEEQDRVTHKTIAGVSDDLDKMQFNTAIAKLMEFVNAASSWDVRPQQSIESFVLLLSPFAPHLAEELWSILGHESTLAYEPWPTHDPEKLVESEIEIPVQVNGKLRAKVRVAADADQDAMRAAAESDEAIKSHLEGKTIRKAIVVPGRMVNFVVG